MDKMYAVIWFEGSGTYTLVDHQDNMVLLTKEEVAQGDIPVLKTEDQVDQAEEDIRYAIDPELMQDIFG